MLHGFLLFTQNHPAMPRTAIYAGSFDPPTLGHHWLICQGAAMFDELIIALAVNPDKKPFLPLEQRRSLLLQMAAGVAGQVRVEVVQQRFIADYAREVGADCLLRGVRNTTDFEYEKNMARMNERMAPGLRTVFLIPPAELEDISSSLTRGLVGNEGWERWVKACVPQAVFDGISAACNDQHS